MVKQLHETMSEVLNEHKRTYDDDTMRNLTDVYIKQIKESNDPNFNGMYYTSQMTHKLAAILNEILVSCTLINSLTFYRGAIDSNIDGFVPCWSRNNLHDPYMVLDKSNYTSRETKEDSRRVRSSFRRCPAIPTV